MSHCIFIFAGVSLCMCVSWTSGALGRVAFLSPAGGGIKMPCDPMPYKPRRPYGRIRSREVEGHEVERHFYPPQAGG